MSPAVFLASHDFVTTYLSRIFTPDPFRGIYEVNSFDLLLLIPYFTVLTILAVYGFHRYVLVYKYFKHRQNRPVPPVERLDPLPRVTIQLPIFNERFVVERLIEEVCRMEYPRELLEIQVLDDSTDDTVAVAQNCVERYATLGYPITYHHRTNREGYKAGALAEGMRSATGEFIAIFDADFLPPSDFLLKTLPYFQDAGIGMVQTRWSYINRDYSMLTKIQSILLDGHFVLEHGARSRAGCFFNFNGTAGIWRRRAIEEAGGWEHDTLTEDTDLSYRAQLRGWRFVYQPDIACASELPSLMSSFKSQQARWAKGLIQTSRKLLPTIWRSTVPRHIKVEATFHLTANVCYPLMIVMEALLLPAMIVRFYQGWFQMLYIDLPLLIAATCSISTFYLAAQRELFPDSWKRSIAYMPLIMAAGIGLSITNARAVLEALFGKPSEFVRTPKYRIESKSDRVMTRLYRHRLNWVPAVEILIGCYFVFTVYYAFQNENYATLPFLLLFVAGYLGTGLYSAFEGKWEKLAEFFASRVALPAKKGLQES
ncbi:MAG: glycosyltransferase [Acidobacteria bacterium]|nr:glycosyltransferase [Acidobacteriota bacterium]